MEQDIDRIAPDDKYAERRHADMTRRLNDLYDQIYKAEDLLQESMMKKATLESEQMSVQSMIGILSSFDAIYDRMNSAERRDLVKYLISEVELFPREEQKTQKRFVKAIAYKFPIEQKVLTQFDELNAIHQFFRHKEIIKPPTPIFQTLIQSVTPPCIASLIWMEVPNNITKTTEFTLIESLLNSR